MNTTNPDQAKEQSPDANLVRTFFEAYSLGEKNQAQATGLTELTRKQRVLRETIADMPRRAEAAYEAALDHDEGDRYSEGLREGWDQAIEHLENTLRLIDRQDVAEVIRKLAAKYGLPGR